MGLFNRLATWPVYTSRAVVMRTGVPPVHSAPRRSASARA
jgi:hypothetical protein